MSKTFVKAFVALMSLSSLSHQARASVLEETLASLKEDTSLRRGLHKRYQETNQIIGYRHERTIIDNDGAKYNLVLVSTGDHGEMLLFKGIPSQGSEGIQCLFIYPFKHKGHNVPRFVKVVPRSFMDSKARVCRPCYTTTSLTGFGTTLTIKDDSESYIAYDYSSQRDAFCLMMPPSAKLSHLDEFLVSLADIISPEELYTIPSLPKKFWHVFAIDDDGFSGICLVKVPNGRDRRKYKHFYPEGLSTTDGRMMIEDCMAQTK